MEEPVFKMQIVRRHFAFVIPATLGTTVNLVCSHDETKHFIWVIPNRTVLDWPGASCISCHQMQIISTGELGINQSMLRSWQSSLLVPVGFTLNFFWYKLTFSHDLNLISRDDCFFDSLKVFNTHWWSLLLFLWVYVSPYSIRTEMEV